MGLATIDPHSHKVQAKLYKIPKFGVNRPKRKQDTAVTHSNINPRSGQYLTHVHSHITRAVAAMDSCFGLVRLHQHGI